MWIFPMGCRNAAAPVPRLIVGYGADRGRLLVLEPCPHSGFGNGKRGGLILAELHSGRMLYIYLQLVVSL